jgi:hypothetical protein
VGYGGVMQNCEICEKPIKHDDEVIAKIHTRFKALKSKVIYALEKPIECYGLSHWECVFSDDENDEDSYED